MDRQRIPSYLYLIEELLRCSPGREEAVLSDNSDLLDADLLKMMEQRAAVEKDEDTVKRLNILAKLLFEKLKPPSRGDREQLANQDQLDFLSKVFQASEESNGDSKVLYPLLQQNLDKLDNKFADILRNWANAKFSEIEVDQAKGIAIYIAVFSNLIQQFPLGNKANNMEISIAGYEVILKVFTYESYREIWATLQNNLGAAYSNRIRGGKAENLESTIAAYQQALQVLTQTDFPLKWAATQNNLGFTYIQRIRGNKAENLESAIAAYQQALLVRTPTDFPMDWATTQTGLGNAYRERIRGNKAENLESAIAAFKQALLVLTQTDLPIDWAMTQNNLGNAYIDRIRGDKAENLESAIAAYQQALLVFTQTDLPMEWAATQNNLGFTYIQRIRGDKAENLESAIAAFKQALLVLTQTDLPIDWATTQTGLGNAYSNRIRGDKAENLESAITAYQQALLVRTQTDFPMDWATTQTGLGAAYRERIRGDKAENLECAIAAFQQALLVFTQTDFPMDWATTQTGLGNAYRERIRGDKAENLESAIAAYQQALQVRTQTDFPIDWAMTQNNLGNAYIQRIRGNKAENLESAIAAYQQALLVRTQTDFPMNWATIQNNLGNAYRERIRGNKAENLESAIAACQQALLVQTQTDFPMNWATTQTGLGNAYRERIRGDKAENLESAIAAYQQALLVRTLEADPIDHLITTNNLGNLYFANQNWQIAAENYEKAITAVELSRSWATNDDRRQEILAEAIGVYQKLVQAYINIEQWDKAIETVERSKTRNLVELLANRELYPKGDVPEEIISQLDRLRPSIPSLERRLQAVIDSLSANTGEREEQQRRSLLASQKQLQLQLQTSRQQLDEVLDRIKPIDSNFSLTQRVEQISWSDIQSLIDDRTAAIEWYVTEDKILTFIITAKSLLVEQASEQELDALINWANDYFGAYLQKDKEKWIDDLAANLQKLAEILNIDRLLTQIDEIFDKQGGKCARLILIPHRILHLFPLHAMPIANGDLLMERFSQGLSYAPSLQLLQLTQKWSRSSLQHFFSVKNPTEDLSFADIEVNTIRRYFNPHDNVLEKQKASKTALTQERLAQTNVAHFSCHGYFNFESPIQSALLLAGSKTARTKETADKTRFWESRDGNAINLEKCLTLGDIFALDLRQCRLTSLSACETGLSDLKSFGDEYIGLPSGFLYAGSPSVVSSLWTVDDLSTAFLMIQFYKNLRNSQGPTNVAIALNQAQLWLRDLTKEELQKWIVENQISLNPTLKMNLRRRLNKMSDSDRPFESPFYWAAFCAIGQ